ncbi:hypothetical protein C8R46DRAFT_1192789, partial [Mycena filopes]
MSSLVSNLSPSLSKDATRPLLALVGVGIKLALLVVSGTPTSSPTRTVSLTPSKTSFDPRNVSSSPVSIATSAIVITTLVLGVLYAKGFFGQGGGGGNQPEIDPNGGVDGERGSPPDADPSVDHDHEPGSDHHGDDKLVDTGEEPPPPPPRAVAVDSWLPRRWRLLLLLLLLLLAFYLRETLRQNLKMAIKAYQFKRAFQLHWFTGRILRVVKRMRNDPLGQIVLNSLICCLHPAHAMFALVIIYGVYTSMWLYGRWILFPLPCFAARFSIRHPLPGSLLATSLLAFLASAIHYGYFTLHDLLIWARLPVLHYLCGGPLFLATFGIDLCFTITEQWTVLYHKYTQIPGYHLISLPRQDTDALNSVLLYPVLVVCISAPSFGVIGDESFTRFLAPVFTLPLHVASSSLPIPMGPESTALNPPTPTDSDSAFASDPTQAPTHVGPQPTASRSASDSSGYRAILFSVEPSNGENLFRQRWRLPRTTTHRVRLLHPEQSPASSEQPANSVNLRRRNSPKNRDRRFRFAGHPNLPPTRRALDRRRYAASQLNRNGRLTTFSLLAPEPPSASKMKLTSRPIVVPRVPLFQRKSPSPLKPLLLVNRMREIEQPTSPKKRRGNPAVKVLRLLGLKKKKVKADIECDGYVIVAATSPTTPKAPFIVPRSCEPSTRRILPRPASAMSRVSPRGAGAQEALRFIAPPPAAFSKPALSHPVLGRLDRKEASTPVKLGSYTKAARTTPFKKSDVVVPPAGLRPLRLRTDAMPVRIPVPLATLSPISVASSPPTKSKSTSSSRIPRYVARQSTALPVHLDDACVLSGALKIAATPLNTADADSTAPIPDPATFHTIKSPAIRLMSVATIQTQEEEFVDFKTAAVSVPNVEGPRKISSDMAVQTEASPNEASKIVCAEMGIQTELETVPPVESEAIPSALSATSSDGADTKPGILAALKALQGRMVAENSSPPKAEKENQVANPWTRAKRDSSSLLDELKERVSRRKANPTPSPTPSTKLPRAHSKSEFAVLKSRRAAVVVSKENTGQEEEGEEGELMQLFRRRGVDGVGRIPLGVVDKNTAIPNQQALRGPRKLRRIVVPPVVEGSVPSRNPQIQSEINRLRAQGKVGGKAVAGQEGYPQKIHKIGGARVEVDARKRAVVAPKAKTE